MSETNNQERSGFEVKLDEFEDAVEAEEQQVADNRERKAAPQTVWVVTQGSCASFDKLTYEDCVDSVVGVAGCLEDAQALAQRNVEQLAEHRVPVGAAASLHRMAFELHRELRMIPEFFSVVRCDHDDAVLEYTPGLERVDQTPDL